MIKNKTVLFILLIAVQIFSTGSHGNQPFLHNFQNPAFARDQRAIQTEKINFAELGYKEPAILNGPYQKFSIIFSLPPDWQLTGDIQMELDVQVAFQSLMGAFVPSDPESVPANQKGTLQVRINQSLVAEYELFESGEQLLPFTFQSNLIKEDLQDNEISISWESNTACKYDITTILAVAPSSWISFPFQLKNIEIDLVEFPKPFYSSTSLHSYPTAILLPDNPGESELSALMAVVAGLGKQTNGDLDYEIILMDEAARRDLGNYHLIMVGLQADIVDFFGNQINDLQEAISQAGVHKQSGILWYQRSPLNSGRTLLVVTGEDSASLTMASAITAATDFVPFSNGNIAIVSNLTSIARDEQLKIDYELGELISPDTADLRVDGIGVSQVKIPFHIPGDVVITPESYLELYFRHSQRINYLRSGLTISINGKNIGSIRFSDNTAENGLARIILPPDSVTPQKNELELTYTISAQGLCADERDGDYWITIFKESYLHLPPELSRESSKKAANFSDLPWAFLKDDRMADLTFVGLQNDVELWRLASQIAFKLGSFSDSSLLMPSVLLAESWLTTPVPEHTILLGTTDNISSFKNIERLLPVPIGANGSIDTLTINGIQYNLDVNKDLGFIGASYDGESDSQILFVLGNTQKGLLSATNSLVEILSSDVNSSANVRVIDSKPNVFDFTVEQAITEEYDQLEEGGGWLQRMLWQDMRTSNIILLGCFVLITTIYLVWSILTSKQKR